ncbi:MAG: hypothetical protein JXQ76_07800 [Campylobacterales bacterium]|nr:hypothetical protein [Campylobacterales bacterium]
MQEKQLNDALTLLKLIELSEEDILNGRVIDQDEMFDELEATYFLAKSQANAKRLDCAIAQLEAGEGKERQLIEE